jgi:GT2 family glycosyltransferase
LPAAAFEASPRDVSLLSGAALLFGREHFLALGGFDPAFGRGDFEDLELSLRWRRSMGPVQLELRSRLTHLERQSISREPDRLAQWRQRLNSWMAVQLCDELVAPAR